MSDPLERFERQTAVPMLVLSLVIVPLLVVPLVFDLPPTTETTIVPEHPRQLGLARRLENYELP
jgi:hypothetical protein